MLGPPTLEQSEKIRNETDEDANEFWQLQSGAGRFVANRKSRLFPRNHTYLGKALPEEVRWLVPRLDMIRGDELLELVTVLDDAMNNTSVILVFEVGGRTLLFPGDAQIENWSYALDKSKTSPALKKLLAKVDIYKVGHHGSRNATPKTLWGMLDHKAAKGKPGRLQSFMSTKSGKHGKTEKTAVPSKTLSAALTASSDLLTTETYKPAEFVELATFTA